MEITVGDMFLQHIQRHPEDAQPRQRKNAKKPTPPKKAVLVEGKTCSLCGRENGPFYRREEILSDNFTDMDIWRHPLSIGVCFPCWTMIVHGKRGFPVVRSFLAFGDSEDDTFESHFPWNTYDLPWYRIPPIRPLVVVVPGTTYEKKHTLFRAQVVFDPDWIGIWHGDHPNGMLYVPTSTAEVVCKQEDLWNANGYPAPKEINAFITELLSSEPLIRELTKKSLFFQRKKQIALKG